MPAQFSNVDRPVRTIPPYIRSVEDDDYTPEEFAYFRNTENLANTTPFRPAASSDSPFRHYIPELRRFSDDQPGRRFDRTRTTETPIISTPFPLYGSRWLSFASPTTGGPPRRRITDEEAREAQQILSAYDRQRDPEDERNFGLEKELARKRRKQSMYQKLNVRSHKGARVMKKSVRILQRRHSDICLSSPSNEEKPQLRLYKTSDSSSRLELLSTLYPSSFLITVPESPPERQAHAASPSTTSLDLRLNGSSAKRKYLPISAE